MRITEKEAQDLGIKISDNPPVYYCGVNNTNGSYIYTIDDPKLGPISYGFDPEYLRELLLMVSDMMVREKDIVLAFERQKCKTRFLKGEAQKKSYEAKEKEAISNLDSALEKLKMVSAKTDTTLNSNN